MSVRLCHSVDEIRAAVRQLRDEGRRIVLVPTMGDLHEGHLSLVRDAKRLGEVVVSIFVNPTQFAPGEDYERYPRRLAEDVEKLRRFEPVTVFAPTPDEMYPEGETTRVEVREISEPLCGRHREGHFLGVTTVCTKLFTIVQPDAAVFGQKDAQQCLVLDRLVRDLLLPIDLVFSPTVREDDGLAMSSRNRYLEGPERTLATVLSRALAAGRRRLEQGERRVSAVEEAMEDVFADAGVTADYAELRTVPRLEHPETASGRILLAAAGYVGKARLIDNLCLDVREDAVVEAPLVDRCTLDAVLRRWH